MELTVTSTIAQVLPQLEQFTSKQAPFAIAKALTATAQAVRAEMIKQTPVAFSEPGAFTRNAWAIQKADKQGLTAYVFAKDKQARYLKFGVQGGGRRIKGYEKKLEALGVAPTTYLVPTRNIKLNSQGNVPLSTFKRIETNLMGPMAKYFVGKPENDRRSFGVYERQANGSLKALFVERKSKPQYKTRLDMPTIGKHVVDAEFVAQLRQSWAFAMRTAKR